MVKGKADLLGDWMNVRVTGRVTEWLFGLVGGPGGFRMLKVLRCNKWGLPLSVDPALGCCNTIQEHISLSLSLSRVQIHTLSMLV